MNKMLKKLNSKKNGKKGFTLMEMLIVVAIIAILVAIAIPTFTSTLNKANERVDMANQRSAKSMAYTEYLLDEDTDGAVYYAVLKGDKGDQMTIETSVPATGVSYYKVDIAAAGGITVGELTKA